jgi:hypothetical protein
MFLEYFNNEGCLMDIASLLYLASDMMHWLYCKYNAILAGFLFFVHNMLYDTVQELISLINKTLRLCMSCYAVQ